MGNTRSARLIIVVVTVFGLIALLQVGNYIRMTSEFQADAASVDDDVEFFMELQRTQFRNVVWSFGGSLVILVIVFVIRAKRRQEMAESAFPLPQAEPVRSYSGSLPTPNQSLPSKNIAIRADFLKKLRELAVQKHSTVADLLDDALNDYLRKR